MDAINFNLTPRDQLRASYQLKLGRINVGFSLVANCLYVCKQMEIWNNVLQKYIIVRFMSERFIEIEIPPSSGLSH